MSDGFDPSNLNLSVDSSDNPSQSPKNSSIGTSQQNSAQKNNELNMEGKNTLTIPKNDVLGALSEDTGENDIEQDNDILGSIIKKQEKNQQAGEQKDVKKKKVTDINISSLEVIVSLMHEEKYEYVLVEPEDSQVKITFRQDNIDKDIKYVKYPIYTNILFKLKQTTKLIIEDTGSPQEGKGPLKIGSKTFKILSKTAPGENGEKIWIKAIQDTSKVGKKHVKKTSLSMIFGFLGAILFTSLIIGGAFIGFIVFNAKTIEDVKFFASLGINLNDINTFISQIVTLIFTILLVICVTVLSAALFKALFTKKAYKRKKIIYSVVSALLFVMSISVGSAWMFIDRKIQNLPNWQQQAYGDLKIFDNNLLISDDFSEDQSLVIDTENLIGPVDLKFDLTNFQDNQLRKGLTIEKYIWNFGDETLETFAPSVNKTFNSVGNYEIQITAVGKDVQGEEVSQELADVPSISLSHNIEIEETITSIGGKVLSFDASSLSNLGEIDWYLYEPKTPTNTQPRYPEWEKTQTGYEFLPSIIFFEEAYVGIMIRSGNQAKESFDKIIRIANEGIANISGEITFDQSAENELLYNFYVTKPQTDFGNGFIESYRWSIGDKTYNSISELGESNDSPKIEHIFTQFGEQEVSVALTDSAGNTETITKTITIQKKVKLQSPLLIENDGEAIDNLRYEENTHEYFIDDFGIPGVISLDARRVRPVNILYVLDSVSWDVGGDGNIDGTGKIFNYEVPTEGSHIIVAEYKFQHRRTEDDVIILKESVFIEGVKKEAILDLKFEYPSNYVPVTVRFDASASFIKNDNIVKFIYDYGDGIVEERDAINPGHRYSQAGNYNVKLTVLGESGKSYSTEKSLILLPAAQGVKISTSLKKAPIGQGIDFSSAESSGQIVEYFWDFGDGNISTAANPTHSYKKVGIYTVELKADFANNNTIVDKLEIEVVQEDE